MIAHIDIGTTYIQLYNMKTRRDHKVGGRISKFEVVSANTYGVRWPQTSMIFVTMVKIHFFC